jgi:hypothetical protein
MLSFRTKQADFFFFPSRSCERVGLRRETSAPSLTFFVTMKSLFASVHSLATLHCHSARPRLGAIPVTAFDSLILPCHHVAMPDRNLKIARFIGSTPSVAYCDLCRLVFNTRQEFLVDSDKALQQLKSDFDKHECKPEAGAVNSALDDIR